MDNEFTEMHAERIEIIHIFPKELKKGHRIINVGTVKSVEEYINVVVVKICNACINNAQEVVQLPPYHSVKVEAIEGRPCIYDGGDL